MPEFDFIKAAMCQPHDRVPIWIMRQAGRYLPEYRAVRKKVTFMELCRSAELMAEVTSQPIDIFGFDAAILFSDILLPLEQMGPKVVFDEGGPKIKPPIRSTDDVAAINVFNPAEKMDYVLNGLKAIKKRLNGQVPLIGFCGSPWTLACYMIEGGGSPSFIETKKFMYNHPKDMAILLDKLAEVTGHYLKAQIEAGADAVQLFDSWGGIIPPEHYRKFSLAFNKKVFDICKTDGIPRIMYLNNSGPYLHLLAEMDCEVVGIDWRTDIMLADKILDGKAIQGNIDPHMLFGSPDELLKQTNILLEQTAKRDGFIFNLGHGILPTAPVENVRLLVETVHSFKRPSGHDA